MVQSVDCEEELLPPPLSLLGEGDGTVEEERTGQSARFNGPGMDGKLGLALGRELGAGRDEGWEWKILGRHWCISINLFLNRRDGILGVSWVTSETGFGLVRGRGRQ